jgi:hypothetical protein
MSISNIDKIREKLEKLKKLADAMYYAAQYLTTDASRLHKAMDEYRQFIIHEWREEPVSKDLEEASKEWLRPQLDKSYADYGEIKMMELTRFDGYAMLDAIEFGAKLKEQQMMAKAIDGYVIEDIEEGCGDFLLSAEYLPKSMGLKDQQRVKVIVIKEE